MELEIKDYYWDIILDWEALVHSINIPETQLSYAKGDINGRISMLALVTGRDAIDVRNAVLEEAHSVGRLLDVKSN